MQLDVYRLQLYLSRRQLRQTGKRSDELVAGGKKLPAPREASGSVGEDTWGRGVVRIHFRFQIISFRKEVLAKVKSHVLKHSSLDLLSMSHHGVENMIVSLFGDFVMARLELIRKTGYSREIEVGQNPSASTP